MLISSITGILECFALALQKPQVRVRNIDLVNQQCLLDDQSLLAWQ